MLGPQIVVNLLPKLAVGMDLVRFRNGLGEMVARRSGTLIQCRLLTNALRFEVNEFHKRLSSWS